MQRQPANPRIRFKHKDKKGILVATGKFLPVPQTGGRQLLFQIEGEARADVWLLTFTATWLVKNQYGRSAEGKEELLSMKAAQVVRRWLERGLSGNQEILVHTGAAEGALRRIVRP